MVSIELWPIRYARLVVEQEAREESARVQAAREQSERDEAAQAQAAKEQVERDARDKVVQEAQAKTEREAREKAEQVERDRAAREEAAGVTWTDIATGLMWTKKGKGNLNWKQAIAYCQNLQLAGHSDWRLPRIEELQGIYDHDAGFGSHNVKGNLQVPKSWEWSSSQGDSSEKVSMFDFKDGIRRLRLNLGAIGHMCSGLETLERCVFVMPVNDFWRVSHSMRPMFSLLAERTTTQVCPCAREAKLALQQ